MPYCRTVAQISESAYALPRNTLLKLEEVLAPPWTARFYRWYKWVDEYHVFFCDRSYTIYAADENIHFSTTYRQLQVGGRKRYEICAPPNHQRRGKFVKAIGYSSDRIFDRTITGCRCVALTVAYDMPASALIRTGSSVAAMAASTAVASAMCATRMAVDELMSRVEAAEVAQRLCWRRRTPIRRRRCRSRPRGRRRSSTSARQAAVHGACRCRATRMRRDGISRMMRRIARWRRNRRGMPVRMRRFGWLRRRLHERRRIARHGTRRRQEAAALNASRRLAKDETRTTSDAAAAEQERQMAKARAAADDPPVVILIDAT